MTLTLAIIGILLSLFACLASYANYRRQIDFHRAWMRQRNELQAEIDRLRNFLNV
jgi:CHASE1-domain containing sensor protein